MKKIHLLFLDHSISLSSIAKIISQSFNLCALNFVTLFREQIMNEKSELTKELKYYMDSGELIPTILIEKFLKTQINKSKESDILLFHFPKTYEQYKILENIISDLEFTIEKIWYIKQQSPEIFLKEYLEYNENWYDKFGDEIIEKWKSEYENKRQNIETIQKITKNENWKIIEIDYRAELNEENIIKKINDCT
jgi:adenylate kinase family enzyme